MNISQCLYFPVPKFPISDVITISSGFAIGLNIILAVIASIGNALTIIAILRTKELKTKSNILILFLAITDLLVGLIVQPLFITYELITILEADTLCSVVVVFTLTRVLCTILSLATVLLVSLERSLAVFKPFSYPTLISRQRLVAGVCFLWIFWTLVVLTRMIGLSTKAFRILVSAIIVTCHVSTGFAYVRIQKLASKHLRSIKAQFNRPESRNAFLRHFSENKALRTTMIITGCVFLCYAPLVVVLLTNIIMGKTLHPSTSHIMFTWADTLVFSNSSLNPIIYCLRNVQFRRAIANILGLKLRDERSDRYYGNGRSSTIESAVSQMSLDDPVLLSFRHLNAQ